MFRSSPQEHYHSPWNLLEMYVLGLVFSVVTMGAGVYWWEGAMVDKLSAMLGQSCTVKGGPILDTNSVSWSTHCWGVPVDWASQI